MQVGVSGSDAEFFRRMKESFAHLDDGMVRTTTERFGRSAISVVATCDLRARGGRAVPTYSFFNVRERTSGSDGIPAEYVTQRCVDPVHGRTRELNLTQPQIFARVCDGQARSSELARQAYRHNCHFVARFSLSSPGGRAVLDAGHSDPRPECLRIYQGIQVSNDAQGLLVSALGDCPGASLIARMAGDLSRRSLRETGFSERVRRAADECVRDVCLCRKEGVFEDLNGLFQMGNPTSRKFYLAERELFRQLGNSEQALRSQCPIPESPIQYFDDSTGGNGQAESFSKNTPPRALLLKDEEVAACPNCGSSPEVGASGAGTGERSETDRGI